jgi:orotidine-5'-phosphate decarboxylase
LKTSMQWASSEKMMFVVGATRAEDIAEVRKLAPDYFFLVPGVGAQGGSLEDVVKYGANKECGLLVNSSRGIIYASSGLDFANEAKKEALKIQNQMALHVQRWNL